MNLRQRPFSVAQLAANLQDAWHYFDTAIAGSGNFESRSSHTLYNRLELYRQGKESLIDAVDVTSGSYALRDEANDLPNHDEIETDTELKALAKKGRSIAEGIAKKFGVDAYTGEVL